MISIAQLNRRFNEDKRRAMEDKRMEEEKAVRDSEEPLRQRELETLRASRGNLTFEQFSEDGEFITSVDEYKYKPLLAINESLDDAESIQDKLDRLKGDEVLFFPRLGSVYAGFSVVLNTPEDIYQGETKSVAEHFFDEFGIEVPKKQLLVGHKNMSPGIPVTEMFIIQVKGLTWDVKEEARVKISELPRYPIYYEIREAREEDFLERSVVTRYDPDNYTKFEFRQLCPELKHQETVTDVQDCIDSLESNEAVFYPLGRKILYNCKAIKWMFNTIKPAHSRNTGKEILTARHQKHIEPNQLVVQCEESYFPISELFVVTVPSIKALKDDRIKRKEIMKEMKKKHSMDRPASEETKKIKEVYKGKKKLEDGEGNYLSRH